MWASQGLRQIVHSCLQRSKAFKNSYLIQENTQGSTLWPPGTLCPLSPCKLVSSPAKLHPKISSSSTHGSRPTNSILTVLQRAAVHLTVESPLRILSVRFAVLYLMLICFFLHLHFIPQTAPAIAPRAPRPQATMGFLCVEMFMFPEPHGWFPKRENQYLLLFPIGIFWVGAQPRRPLWSSPGDSVVLPLVNNYCPEQMLDKGPLSWKEEGVSWCSPCESRRSKDQ